MMQEHEKLTLKQLRQSWRIIVIPLAAVASFYGGLVAAGFADIPAAARALSRLEMVVGDNTIQVGTIIRRQERDLRREAVRVEREIHRDRRFKRIEDQQKETTTDIKTILRLLYNSRDNRQPTRMPRGR